jgi:hypothetical protein
MGSNRERTHRPGRCSRRSGTSRAFTREHEKFYSQAPLAAACDAQAASRTLKALATQWSEADPAQHPVPNPFAGAEDLNAPGLVAEHGVLFMEGEGEPAEIKRMKRDLGNLAADLDETGAWLSAAISAAAEAHKRLRYRTPRGRQGVRDRATAKDSSAACARSAKPSSSAIDSASPAAATSRSGTESRAALKQKKTRPS